jgi:hypothetical protein
MSGPNTGSVSATYSGTLNSGDTDTLLVGYLNTSAGGRFNFEAISNLSSDSYRINDTLIAEGLLIDRQPELPSIGNNVVVCTNVDTVIKIQSQARKHLWYDAMVGGNLLSTTDSLRINISQPDTFYVISTEDYESSVGMSDNSGNGANYTSTMTQGIRFDVTRPLTIDSLTVYPFDSGLVRINLLDNQGTNLMDTSFVVYPQLGSRIPVDFQVMPGKDYRLTATGSNTSGLWYNYPSNYPFRDSDSSMIITGDINGGTYYYYFFYDLKISVEGCESGMNVIPVGVRPSPPVNLGNDTAYCTGSSFNLTLDATAAGASSYRWMNGSTSTTLSTSTQGNYRVTVTGTNGCVISDTVVVTEVPQPNVTFTDITLCDNIGLSTIFAGTPKGGTYSGTGASGPKFDPGAAGLGTHKLVYTYSDAIGCYGVDSGFVTVVQAPTATMTNIGNVCQSNAAVTLNQGSPSGGYYYGTYVGFNDYRPVRVGPDTVYYVFVGSNGCADTASGTVNVLASPQITFNPALEYCENTQAVTLNALPAGGSFSGTGVSGTTFDPATAGTGTHFVIYTVTGSNSCTSKSGKNFVVHEKPQVTFNTLPSVCENSGVFNIPSAFPTGGVYKGNFVDPGNKTFDVDMAGAGTYPITYVVTNDESCMDSVTQNLLVQAYPVVNLGGDKQICGSYTVTLDAGNPGANYYWSTGDNSQSIVVDRSGKFKVRVNLNGCESTDSVEVSYEVICVGIDEPLAGQYRLELYPNPVSGDLNVKIDSEKAGEINLTLFDLTGSEVLRQQVEILGGENHHQLDLRFLSSGVYMLNIETNEGSGTYRIEVSR